MDRNKILITILAIVGLIFVGLILLLTQQSQTKVLNQVTNLQEAPTPLPPDAVYGLLQPEIINATLNQPFTIKLTFTNLKRPLQGADLILNYDPEILEFVQTQNLSVKFLNTRALYDEETNNLIVSFVEKADQQEPTSSELLMVELNFVAKKIGQVVLTPLLNDQANSSMAIIKGSSVNKLVSINPVKINIQ